MILGFNVITMLKNKAKLVSVIAGLLVISIFVIVNNTQTNLFKGLTQIQNDRWTLIKHPNAISNIIEADIPEIIEQSAEKQTINKKTPISERGSTSINFDWRYVYSYSIRNSNGTYSTIRTPGTAPFVQAQLTIKDNNNQILAHFAKDYMDFTSAERQANKYNFNWDGITCGVYNPTTNTIANERITTQGINPEKIDNRECEPGRYKAQIDVYFKTVNTESQLENPEQRGYAVVSIEENLQLNESQLEPFDVKFTFPNKLSSLSNFSNIDSGAAEQKRRLKSSVQALDINIGDTSATQFKFKSEGEKIKEYDVNLITLDADGTPNLKRSFGPIQYTDGNLPRIGNEITYNWQNEGDFCLASNRNNCENDDYAIKFIFKSESGKRSNYEIPINFTNIPRGSAPEDDNFNVNFTSPTKLKNRNNNYDKRVLNLTTTYELKSDKSPLILSKNTINFNMASESRYNYYAKIVYSKNGAIRTFDLAQNETQNLKLENPVSLYTSIDYCAEESDNCDLVFGFKDLDNPERRVTYSTAIVFDSEDLPIDDNLNSDFDVQFNSPRVLSKRSTNFEKNENNFVTQYTTRNNSYITVTSTPTIFDFESDQQFEATLILEYSEGTDRKNITLKEKATSDFTWNNAKSIYQTINTCTSIEDNCKIFVKFDSKNLAPQRTIIYDAYFVFNRSITTPSTPDTEEDIFDVKFTTPNKISNLRNFDNLNSETAEKTRRLKDSVSALNINISDDYGTEFKFKAEQEKIKKFDVNLTTIQSDGTTQFRKNLIRIDYTTRTLPTIDSEITYAWSNEGDFCLASDRNNCDNNDYAIKFIFTSESGKKISYEIPVNFTNIPNNQKPDNQNDNITCTLNHEFTKNTQYNPKDGQLKLTYKIDGKNNSAVNTKITLSGPFTGKKLNVNKNTPVKNEEILNRENLILDITSEATFNGKVDINGDKKKDIIPDGKYILTLQINDPSNDNELCQKRKVLYVDHKDEETGESVIELSTNKTEFDITDEELYGKIKISKDSVRTVVNLYEVVDEDEEDNPPIATVFYRCAASENCPENKGKLEAGEYNFLISNLITKNGTYYINASIKDNKGDIYTDQSEEFEAYGGSNVNPRSCNFSDVSPSNPQYEAIQTVCDLGIMVGNQNQANPTIRSFNPDRAILRIEGITIANRLALCEDFSYSPNYDRDLGFRDLTQFINNRNYDWIFQETLRGINCLRIRGYSDGTLRPAQQMTHAEGWKMVLEGAETGGIANYNLFVNENKNPWWTDYEYILIQDGIRTPFGGQTMTRGQMAQLIKALVDIELIDTL